MSVEEAAKKYLKDERNKLNEIHKDIVTMVNNNGSPRFEL